MRYINIALLLFITHLLHGQIDTVICKTKYATCNNTKPKLCINITGGVKPYSIFLDGILYNRLNNIDSIYPTRSGKFNGTVTDASGISKNVHFIVDT